MGHGQLTAPHSSAHSAWAHWMTGSTWPQVPRSVQDMQQVSTQGCISPSSVHIDCTQVNDGKQKVSREHAS